MQHISDAKPNIRDSVCRVCGRCADGAYFSQYPQLGQLKAEELIAFPQFGQVISAMVYFDFIYLSVVSRSSPDCRSVGLKIIACLHGAVCRLELEAFGIRGRAVDDPHITGTLFVLHTSAGNRR